jgi:hypothetical protein
VLTKYVLFHYFYNILNVPQIENLNHLKNILQKKNDAVANKYLKEIYFASETSTEKT